MMIPSATRPWLEAIDASTLRQNSKPGAGVVLSTFIPLRLVSFAVARSREGLHHQDRALPNDEKNRPEGRLKIPHCAGQGGLELSHRLERPESAGCLLQIQAFSWCRSIAAQVHLERENPIKLTMHRLAQCRLEAPATRLAKHSNGLDSSRHRSGLAGGPGNHPGNSVIEHTRGTSIRGIDRGLHQRAQRVGMDGPSQHRHHQADEQLTWTGHPGSSSSQLQSAWALHRCSLSGSCAARARNPCPWHRPACPHGPVLPPGCGRH